MNTFSYLLCETFMGALRYPGCSVSRNTSPRQDENHLPCSARWWSPSRTKVRNVLQPSMIQRCNRAVSMSGHHVTSSTIFSASVRNKFRKFVQLRGWRCGVVGSLLSARTVSFAACKSRLK